MAIISQTNAKAILGITGTEHDAQITAIIPRIQDFIIRYCRTNFREFRSQISSGGISFTASGNKIADSNENLDEFKVADDVAIEGSFRNDKTMEIKTITDAGNIVMADAETVITEDMSDEATVTLTLVVWPPGITFVVCDMIQYQLEKGGSAGVASESAGGWNASYTEDYPKSLLRKLSQYRKAYV